MCVNCPTCSRERSPSRAAARHDALRLRQRKRPALAEDVHILRQLLPHNAGHELVAEQFHITLRALLELRRHHVRSQKRRHHRSRPRPGRASNRTQALDLRSGVQPVARLRLQRGCPLRLRLPQRRVNMIGQFRLAGRAHVRHAGADSPAGSRNLLIACARHALLKVKQPRPYKRRMRMRIDKAGQHHLAAAIQLNHLRAMLLEPRIAQHLRPAAHGNDPPFGDQHRRIVQHADLAHLPTAPRCASNPRAPSLCTQRHQLRDAMQQHRRAARRGPDSLVARALIARAPASGHHRLPTCLPSES